jgi:hypothetical protein
MLNETKQQLGGSHGFIKETQEWTERAPNGQSWDDSSDKIK